VESLPETFMSMVREVLRELRHGGPVLIYDGLVEKLK